MEAAVAPRDAGPTASVGRPSGLRKLASDDRLVARVRHGDERAFEAIYDRHHRGILAFCRHMLGSREEAEDAVQQTFLSAYRALRDSEQEVALRPWLYAIARNRCLSMLRARREEDPLADVVEPSVVGLAAEVERREDLRQLLHDLHRLPDDQRAALVLSEVADLGHDEIAQVIGVPRKKVKALVFQARESLIASRRAREIPCEEIRAELATLRGGALRRSHLRRHLSECPACRGYREEIRRQRAALAVLLPVVPGVGLKRATLAAAIGGGSGGAAGGAASVAGGTAVLKGTAAKVAIGAVIAAGAVTGGVVGVRELTQSSPPPAAAGASSGAPAAHQGARGANAAPAVAAAASANARPATATTTAASTPAHRRKHHKHHHHKATATPAPAAAPAPAVAPPVAAGHAKKSKDKVKGHPNGKAKGHAKHQGGTTPPKPTQTHPQHPVTPAKPQPKPQTPSTSTPSSSSAEQSGGTQAPGANGKGNGKSNNSGDEPGPDG